MKCLIRPNLIAASVLAGTLGVAVAVIAQQSPPAAPPAASPAAAPATLPTADWPAFHGGGELRGEAKAIHPPESDRPNPGPVGNKLVARWIFRSDNPGPIEASAAIVGQYAYVGDTTGHLYCIALADGKPKWTYEKPDIGFGAPPLVMNGRVYIGDMEGIFHCIDAETGKKVWTYDAESGQPIHAGANALGDRIVYGDDGANILCVNTEGKLQWKFTAGDRINAAPAIGNGLAFISGCDSILRAIDVASGKEKYTFELPSLAPGSPAFLGDRLIIGTDGGRVVCVAADGSKALWTYEQVKESAMVYGSPAASEGITVVGARDRHVHAIGVADGKQKWTFATQGDVDSSPAIAGGRVYVGSRDKMLYMLDLKTGKKLGEFKAGFALEASPAIGQGVIVIGDGRGAVYCLEVK